MPHYQSFTDARYPTLQDFLDATALPCRHKSNSASHSEFMNDEHRGDWYGAGCRTGKDVAQLVRDGWPEGRARLTAFRDKLESPLQPIDRRRRVTRGPSGDSLDMPTVWSGRLDIAWRAPRRVISQAPARIDIAANMTCAGIVHSDVLFWRGAAAVALADLLESAGYMVRLVVLFGGKTENDLKTSCRVTVKDHGAPLDVTSTSAVILPGFFRALGHAWVQNHAPHRRHMGGIFVGSGIIDENEITLTHNVHDHSTALAFVNATVARLNGDRVAA